MLNDRVRDLIVRDLDLGLKADFCWHARRAVSDAQACGKYSR